MNILSINGEDICGISQTLSNAVNQYTKHNSRVLVNTLSVRQIPYDLVWGMNCHERELREAIEWADILHFNDYPPDTLSFGNVRWADYWDDKKIVITEHGSALRLREDIQHEIDRDGYKLLITMPILFDYVDDEKCRTEWLPFPIPTEDPQYMPLDTELKYPHFAICHAPGEPHRWAIKDTEFFMKACESINLIKPGLVKIELLTRTPWEEAIRIKQKCHVSFDHMQGYYGVNTAESMAMGIPSIANLNYEYELHARERYGKELPIVKADRVTLQKTLLGLRQDYELTMEIGKQSRDYAIKVHDLRTAVLPQLIHAYEEVYNE
jgi:hypothetical protein